VDDGTLLAELESVTTSTAVNVSLMKSEMRDKSGVDAATLASSWGAASEAVKRMRQVTTQMELRRMIHPSLTKRYKTNDSQLRYRLLHVTMFTDTI
jgi:hypothetical protein